MNVFGNLFKNNKVECPRCLGKGEIDNEDIKRLKMEVKWLPGKCAYCDSKGTVSEKMISEIAVDSYYLSEDLTERERKRYINKDEGALSRADHYELMSEKSIAEILYLHKTGNMNSQEIMDFYYLKEDDTTSTEQEKGEFMEYINRVIKYSN